MAKIRDLAQGAEITFIANNKWALLNPSTGLVLLKYSSALSYEKSFTGSLVNSTGTNGLQAHILNKMTDIEKSMVLLTARGNTAVTETQKTSLNVDEIELLEKTTTVNRYVSALSLSEYIRYNSLITVKPTSLDEWLSTPGGTGRQWGIFGQYNNLTTIDSTYTLYPYIIVHLNPDLEIVNGKPVPNAVPTVTITAPTANQTLYENDILTISGTANDADTGNSVTVRYQVNAETVRAIDAFVSTGSEKPFSKTLTFKGGSLYDDDTLIASNLTDGVAHTLKVYATDDQGGQSSITERTFYVVPNRAPSLTVNRPSTEGNTDGDKITINGNFADADGNQATVKYRINGGNGVQVTEGVNGDFEFEVSFAQLELGPNNIVVEVIDSYGSKTSRTVKLTKTAIETPILKSTARYKIEPPTGSATSVLLWVTRDENLQLEASISMTMKGEAESFTPLVVSNSAPSPDFDNAIEDEFYHEADSAKDNIIIQLDLTRASLDINPKIYLVQGVLE